jgi:hypothetical protein
MQPPWCLACPGACKARDDRKLSRPRMELAILLSLAASFCTATSSICQRLGARHLESSGHQVHGFDAWLVFRLAPRPAGTQGRLAERELTRRSWQ